MLVLQLFFLPNQISIHQLNFKVPVKVSVGETCHLQILNNNIIQQMVQVTDVNILFRRFYLADFIPCDRFIEAIEKMHNFIAITVIL